MGWFTKKESVHFERGYHGEVRKVNRAGDKDRGTPVYDALSKQRPKRESFWKGESGKKIISGVKRVDKAVVNYNRRSNPMRPRSHSSYRIQDNYNPFGSMFDTGMNYKPKPKSSSKPRTKYAVVDGKAYPIAGTDKKKKSSSKKKSTDNYFYDYMGKL